MENGAIICNGLQELLTNARRHFKLSSVVTRFIHEEAEESNGSTEDPDSEFRHYYFWYLIIVDLQLPKENAWRHLPGKGYFNLAPLLKGKVP